MSAKTRLIDHLTASRAAGLSASAAADRLMTAHSAAAQGAIDGQPAQPIALSDLSTGLSAAFEAELGPGDLASILRAQFPQASALDIAEAILAALPGTAAPDMYQALASAGFSAADAQGAIDILYPVMIAIQANQAWQPTGIDVTGTTLVTVTCEGGEWTANPATGMCGADGNPSYPAKDGYTLPGAAEGALIGRIGENPPFLVGTSQTLPAGQSGSLSLCINDDLQDRYGVGLLDNVGALTVKVTTAPPR